MAVFTWDANQLGDSGAVMNKIEEKMAGKVQSVMKIRQEPTTSSKGRIKYAKIEARTFASIQLVARIERNKPTRRLGAISQT